MVNQFTHVITWFNHFPMVRDFVPVNVAMLDVWRDQGTPNYVSSTLHIVIKCVMKLLRVKIVLLDKIH